jgi:hypothetical protein
MIRTGQPGEVPGDLAELASKVIRYVDDHRGSWPAGLGARESNHRTD